MAEVIAGSYNSGSANSILPVIRRLQDSGLEVRTLSHGAATNVFNSAGLKNHQQIENNPPQEQISEVIEREKPKVVLTGVSVPDTYSRNIVEHRLIAGAKAFDIPSNSIMDIWGGYKQKFSEVFDDNGVYTGIPNPNLTLIYLPDTLAVMDRVALEDMTAEGFPRERMVITGNPNFDSLASEASSFTESDRAEVKKKIGSPEDKTLIFYAAGMFEQDSGRYGYWDLPVIQTIDEAFNSLPKEKQDSLDLVTRLHPSVPQSDLTKVQDYISDRGFSGLRLLTMHPRELPAKRIILASDLTFTTISTLGIEAAYMGCPVISLQPGLKMEDLLMVSRKGIIPVGYTAEGCRSLVRKGLSSREYREDIVAKNFKNDGKATERVANLVYESLNK